MKAADGCSHAESWEAAHRVPEPIWASQRIPLGEGRVRKQVQKKQHPRPAQAYVAGVRDLIRPLGGPQGPSILEQDHGTCAQGQQGAPQRRAHNKPTRSSVVPNPLSLGHAASQAPTCGLF